MKKPVGSIKAVPMYKSKKDNKLQSVRHQHVKKTGEENERRAKRIR